MPYRFKPQRTLLMGALLLVTAKLPAQSTISSRFPDPEGITADPTGLRRDTSVRVWPPGPRFPLEKWGITAAPVVAYVIDTTGRVELETATFLNSSPAEFMDAVCAFLPKQRFEPFIVADRKSRVLLVETYGFYGFIRLKNLDLAKLKAANALVTQSQEEFSTTPIISVVAKLDRLPHCHPARLR